MLDKPARQYPVFRKMVQSLEQIGAIVEMDLRKLKHDPSELFLRMTQPALWLLIFGQAMQKMKVIPPEYTSYLDFLTPGILAQSILFIGIFYGISLIWEKDVGVLHKILVSPAPRSVLVIGRAVSAGIRGLTQIVAIYFLGFLLGVHFRWEIPAILGVIFTVLLGGGIFATFSLIIACIVKKRERVMGIGQVLTMPLFFASNALYPIDMMPKWLQTVSIMNPLTYQVNALRNFMITGNASTEGLILDFLVSIFTFVVLVVIATRIYPKIVY